VRTHLRQLSAVLALAMLTACGPDYNKTMTRKLSQALGNDFKEYQAFSYPTNNFGLATAYTPQDGRTTPSDTDFLCDMWNCIGIPDDKVPTEAATLLSLNGFAAVGGGGATITLTETEQRDLALNVALPEIYKVINVAGGFEKGHVTKTNMTLGRAHPRKLRRKTMVDHINKLPASDPMKQAFVNGDLVLVVADVVIDAMKVDIEATSAGKQSLDAALGKDVGGAAGKVLSSSKLSLKVSSKTDGTYSFEVARPVIIKRLTKRQPSAGALGEGNDDWTDWIAQAVPVPQS
jgi:hypothetical protein